MTRERRHPDDGGRVTDWTWLEVSTRSDGTRRQLAEAFFYVWRDFENDLPSGRLPISHSGHDETSSKVQTTDFGEETPFLAGSRGE